MPGHKCGRCGMELFMLPDGGGQLVALSYVYPWKRRLQKNGKYAWVESPKRPGKGVWIPHAGACQPARVTRGGRP